MPCKFKEHVYDVKTSDANYVDLFIQAKTAVDDVLVNNMKKYVLNNVDVTMAMQKADLQGAKISFDDGNKNSRDFHACFLLHYDIEVKTVLDAKIFSFIEL